MRQVNESELLYMIITTLRDVPASWWNEAASNHFPRRDRARSMIAETVMHGFDRLEILSHTALDHPAGDDLFTRAAYRHLDHGSDGGSGVPAA
jgi:hypothetical protein